jgi:hypothetical protein
MRLEELRRIGRVDEHWQLEPCAGFPDGVEFRIVELQATAVRLARREAETLADLADPDRSRGYVRFELGDRLLRPARTHVVEADAREHAHAVLHFRRRTQRVHHALETVARHVVGSDHHADIQAVERRAESRQAFCRSKQATGVAVEIDGRVLRRPPHIRRRHECRLGR